MATNSKIEWTHHTFNHVRGCTKVSPECDHCYADTLSWRNPLQLGVWGPKGTRVIAAESAWKEPLKWNRAAAKAGERHRVFCASLADVFEGPETMPAESVEPVEKARDRLFDLICETGNLDWLLLTKRPENIAAALDRQMTRRPFVVHDSAAGPRAERWTNWKEIGMTPARLWPNLWLGTSVGNRRHGVPRIDALRAVPAAVRFLSVEPLLEDLGPLDLTGISWVIVGGESGHGARPMHPEWVTSIRDQCARAGVAFFFKQWGEWKPYRAMTEAEGDALYHPLAEGEYPDTHSRKCRVETTSILTHPMPKGGACDLMFKVGKKAAGRLLDGREWNEFPAAGSVPAPVTVEE